jgi:hypothetical protein
MVELSSQDKELLDCITKRVTHFEETLGNHYANGLWTRMDRLYHGFSDLRKALRGTNGELREDIFRDARKEFGHELFIPHAYAIVETVLPALLSNRPRLLILPRNGASERNVEHMKAVIDAQQSRINMEMRLQSVAKSGLQYGLGVGKSYWLRREAQTQKLKPLARFHPARALGDTHYLETSVEPLFDDPTFEHIPVRDFGWDPFAANIDGARYAWHRTWRDTGYVLSRLADSWKQVELTREDIETGNGSADRYRKSVQGPFEAQGIPVPSATGHREADIHEVIEYHDRGQIVTVLDRKWVVSVIQNETWAGRLPFHIFRPTEVLNQFVGKGEIEPIEDLQLEMNMLRTDRRWAALMALNPVLFYDDGMIDPDKIRIGPGELNAVNGNPQDIIWQLMIKDVPQSSVRETAEIAQDIVRTSGISDTFAGGEAGSQETATGAQLQMAKASARIQNKTRRAEAELMKPILSHWGALNQRHILNDREERAPAPPVPGEPERRWAWFTLGPNELAGEFDYEPDGGSTQPENVPQKRQDAQIKTALAGSPLGQMLDPRQFLISILDDLGLKNPETYVTQGGQPIPPEALQVIAGHLAEFGMDPQQAQELIMASVQETIQAKDAQAQAAQHGADQQGGAQGQPPMAA